MLVYPYDIRTDEPTSISVRVWPKNVANMTKDEFDSITCTSVVELQDIWITRDRPIGFQRRNTLDTSRAVVTKPGL